MTTELEALLRGLNCALHDNIRADTGLFDTEEQGPSPSDHYGHTAATLALATGSHEQWVRGRQALRAWLDTDAHRIGHLPFNRLMLLLTRSVLSSNDADAAGKLMLEEGLRRCTLRRTYPSNNWSLLAQTCRLIEAEPARREAEADRLCALFERWTTAKGAFIDFPSRPRESFSTPLAYHHKALFLAALACWFHDDPRLACHARRLLDWLVHCWDSAGYAGGFGRSTHSLFGDGCLIAALVLMGVEHGDGDEPVRALCNRLDAQRRSDGFLWLNPAGHESGTASWDSYMHLSVYNAWAAAVAGTAIHLRKTRPIPASLENTRWTASQHGLFHDEEAGLACLRTAEGHNVLISTRGQPPQSFSRTEADFRYAGGTIVHLRISDGPPLIPPPVRVARSELMEHPSVAGWTPVFRTSGETLVLDQFSSVSIGQEGSSLEVKLKGTARALFRRTPNTLLERLVATVDWRLLRGLLGRRAALTRSPSVRVSGALTLTLTPEIHGTSITRLTVLDTQIPTERLNPSGHSRMLAGDQLDTHPFEDGNACIRLRSSLPGGAGCTLKGHDARPGAAPQRLDECLRVSIPR